MFVDKIQNKATWLHAVETRRVGRARAWRFVELSRRFQKTPLAARCRNQYINTGCARSVSEFENKRSK